MLLNVKITAKSVSLPCLFLFIGLEKEKENLEKKNQDLEKKIKGK